MENLTPIAKHLVDYFISGKKYSLVFNDDQAQEKVKAIQGAIDEGYFNITKDKYKEVYTITATDKLIDMYSLF